MLAGPSKLNKQQVMERERHQEAMEKQKLLTQDVSDWKERKAAFFSPASTRDSIHEPSPTDHRPIYVDKATMTPPCHYMYQQSGHSIVDDDDRHRSHTAGPYGEAKSGIRRDERPPVKDIVDFLCLDKPPPQLIKLNSMPLTHPADKPTRHRMAADGSAWRGVLRRMATAAFPWRQRLSDGVAGRGRWPSHVVMQDDKVV
ncbi:unnamed protein product [Vitrella brassicaformis CCMP3155]|uniref:Uncharacterized protein n=1 Tax=Vitrella brassicaformis (strain CCMP3155) TaxID=1169540 RepID=A0A0G4FR22_VITBC|nr:unnamed protein product [Vitrella brassicaformis CCMP3155]|eukprot:CEM16671.1 unnamed protein product [Vitrella brassicaformis CCMP3155]